MIESIPLPLIFSVIAFFYSMGGFAGGSSYLLALTMAGTPQVQVQATALFCNLAVSAITFSRFRAAGYFRPRIALPFVIASVPAVYLGALTHLPKPVFIALLGFSLLAASLRIFFSKSEFEVRDGLTLGEIYRWALPLGAVLGFLSGVIGVGGGIFLCPVLILLRWTTVKEASAAASFFILVNSLSGLAGQMQKGFTLHPDFLWLAAAAAIGGIVGSAIGSKKGSPICFQKVLASILCVVSIQLLAKLL